MDDASKKREEKLAKDHEKEMNDYKKEQEKKQDAQKKGMKKAPFKLPLWLRLGNIIMGLVFIGLSFLAMSYEETALDTAIIVLAAILGLSGLSRFINAFYDKELGGTGRLIRFFISLFLMAVAIIAIVYPDLGDDILYILLGIGLLLQGIGRMTTALPHPAFPLWLKLVQVLLGLFSAVIGVMAILPQAIEIDYGISTLLLLVYGFFISGLSRVTLGLVGVGMEKRTE